MDRTYLRKSEVENDGDYAESFGWGSPMDAAMHHVTMEEIDDAAWARPAGLAWSTPSQMVRFADFLMHGDTDVLGDDLRAQMVAEQVNTLWYMDEIHVVIDGYYYDLTFIPEEEGGPSVYVRNRSFVGTRSEGAPEPGVAPSPDRATLERALAPSPLSPPRRPSLP